MRDQGLLVSVHGSVIQRSLIIDGFDSGLNIATVPIKDINAEHLMENDKFHPLISRVLGVPVEFIIDDAQYQNLYHGLCNTDMLDKLPSQEFCGSEKFFFDYWVDELKLQWGLLDSSKRIKLGKNSTYDPNKSLGEDFLALLAANPTPVLGKSDVLGPAFKIMKNAGFFQSKSITVETFQIGLECMMAACHNRTYDRLLKKEVGRYDIPSGQSPETKSESLTTLIETSKKICLAPIAVGGTAAVSQLSQGSYIAALLSTATGSAMTLILIGTVSVADYLVHYLLHKRKSIDYDKQTQQQIEY